MERGDEARRRLERDLHDGAQQRLLALGMQLSALSQRVGDEERARLDAAVDHATLALASLRRLAHGAVPPLLDDAGLFEAIMSLAEQTDLALVLDIGPIAGRRFGPEVRTRRVPPRHWLRHGGAECRSIGRRRGRHGGRHPTRRSGRDISPTRVLDILTTLTVCRPQAAR